MSLVGTRPPTVDEWEQYELHHRSRMSTKPGMINYIHMVTIRMRNIIINTVLIQYGMAFLKNHAMRLYKKKFLKQRIN